MNEKEIVENVFAKSAILIASDMDKLSTDGFKIVGSHNIKKRFNVLFDLILPSDDDGFMLGYGSLADFAHFAGIEQKFVLNEAVENSSSKGEPFIVRIFVPHGHTHKTMTPAKTVIILLGEKDTLMSLVSAFKSAIFDRNFTLDIGNFVFYESKGKDFFSDVLGDFFEKNPAARFRHFVQ